MSVFLTTNHLFLRNPSGEVEDCAAMRDAGFGAVFANVGDYEVRSWDLIRRNAEQANIVFGPWLRTADEHGEFDSNRLTHLLDVADLWGTPLICNSEKEIDATGADITSYIARRIGLRDAAMSMEVRPFASVDWRPLGHLPMLPQNFPNETGIMDSDDEIRRRWHEAGIDCVVITYGAYRSMVPTQFARLSPYGAYTGNDMNRNFMAWQSVGSVSPCQSSEDPVQRIGSQHGITATHDRLKKLDPGGSNPAFDPAKPFVLPVEQLKAWDKWARTMTILVTDHDAQM